jgi:hypothetical protein
MQGLKMRGAACASWWCLEVAGARSVYCSRCSRPKKVKPKKRRAAGLSTFPEFPRVPALSKLRELAARASAVPELERLQRATRAALRTSTAQTELRRLWWRVRMRLYRARERSRRPKRITVQEFLKRCTRA